MSGEGQRLTEVVFCRHCGNSSSMEVKAEYSIDTSQPGMESGEVYELILCPVCEEVLLRNYYWDENMIGPEETSPIILYPSRARSPMGLPDQIDRAWEAALRVKSIDANAHGVLLRRILELVCIDRSANGGTLNEKLKDLASKKEIPEKLVDVAKGIRQMGNIGAHAGTGDLSRLESAIMEDLSRSILDYVYTAPYLAKTAEARLEGLQKRAKPANSEGK